MKINKKNLSKYVLDDLNEIDCIYFNPNTYELCLQADNGCVRFWGYEEDNIAKINMEHSDIPKINKRGCSEVITNTFIAEFYISDLAIEIYFEDDSYIMFRLEPICFNDDNEPYCLADLELKAYYKQLQETSIA